MTKYIDIVSTSDPIATNAALEILKFGGNAFDAALCASMVLSVTLPMSCGIGGDGVFLLWDNNKKISRSLTGLGIIPKKIEPIKKYLSSSSTGSHPKTGILTASVPALPWAWSTITKYCNLPIEKIASSAISLSIEGFKPDKKFKRWTKKNYSVINRDRYLASLFKPYIEDKITENEPLFKQHELGHFISLFAKSCTNNYDWIPKFVDESVNASRSHGGVLAKEDFYCVPLCYDENPISVNIKNTNVLSSGSTTQGYLGLLAAKLMSNYNEYEKNDILEFSKIFHLIYLDRRKYFGDYGEAHQNWLREKLSNISIVKLKKSIEQVDFNNVLEIPEIHESSDTAFFYVVDRDGNAASCIQSLSLGFGSGCSAPNIGLIFNSRLTRGVSLFPNAPNPLSPHARPVNTIFPILALRNKQLEFIGGSVGGDIQVQINAYAIYLLTKYKSLNYWPYNKRWKYSPVADIFDQSFGSVPTISTENEFDESLKNLLIRSGLKIVKKNNVGGNAMYAYLTSDGCISWLDEGRESGLTATL